MNSACQEPFNFRTILGYMAAFFGCWRLLLTCVASFPFLPGLCGLRRGQLQPGLRGRFEQDLLKVRSLQRSLFLGGKRGGYRDDMRTWGHSSVKRSCGTCTSMGTVLAPLKRDRVVPSPQEKVRLVAGPWHRLISVSKTSPDKVLGSLG